MSRELYPFDLGYTDVIKLQDEINKLQAELELSRKIADEAIKNTDILQAKLDEAITDLNNILGLVMTGLPIDGFAQDDWDKHRLYRVEGMLLRTIKKLEEK